MKIKCPVCNVMGYLQRRKNSYRIQHYQGFRNGKRVYTYHRIPSEYLNLLEVNGHKSLEVNKREITLKSLEELCFKRCRSGPVVQWYLNEYEEWLKASHCNKVARYLMSYSLQYIEILSNPKQASKLVVMSKGKRKLVMASLSNLAKFLGCYQHWKNIIKEHGLKWPTQDSLETFLSILNSNINETRQWLPETIPRLPLKYGCVAAFCALTGLRPSEACQSTKLIVELHEKNELDHYLDRELMMLQHFKFKDIFLRRNKNAYISFITKELLDTVLEIKPKIEYIALVSALRRRRIKRKMKELRKLHGTLLRNYGIPKELVDLLHGRISQSIFIKFYYKPFLLDVKNKSLKALKPLEKELLKNF